MSHPLSDCIRDEKGSGDALRAQPALALRAEPASGLDAPRIDQALIDALRQIDMHISHGLMGDWNIALAEIRKIARAAIAKATGQ
jgi:hypothetical protein